IYVNGVLEQSSTEAFTLDVVVDELGITKRGTTEGAIDEIRIWDHARSRAEIASAMDTTVDPQAQGLLGNYRFDNIAEIDDATGNAAPVAIPAQTSIEQSTSPVVFGQNLLPIAEDDGLFNTPVDQAIILDVLANDSDADGTIDPDSLTLITQPLSGSATILGDNTVSFTPGAGFEGIVTFQYTIQDDDGAVSVPATVTVEVGNAAGNVPLPVDDVFSTVEDAIAVPLAVTLNDVDPQGDAISVANFSQAQNGTVTLNNGVLEYTPDADFTGTDTFTYTATDGNYESGPATVTINIAESFTQPQTVIDSRIAPEISPSGLALTVEKVAQVPLSSIGVQPDLNTMAFAGNRLFVGTEGDVDNEGRIWELVDDGMGGQEWELFMDIGQVIPAVTGRDLDNSNPRHGGMRGLDFHPGFDDPTSDGYGKFYTSIMEDRPTDPSQHTYLSDAADPINADSVLVEWTYDHVTEEVITSSYREVFRIGMPVYDHTIRQISFNRFAEPGDEDYGLIYVGHGDGSIQSATAGGGQNNDALGKIIRVDPLQNGNDSYSVPSTNPFVGDPTMIDEVYAIGFRNPAHLSFAEDDLGNSHLLVTAVGRDNFDEVNLITPGGNYGWSEREGPLVHVAAGGGIVNGVAPLPANEADFGYTIPATFVAHGGPVGAGFIGRALTGGYVVQNENSELDDQFIFGEFATTGRVFHADLDELVNAVTTLDPNDPTRDEVSELSWVTAQELIVLYDHDNDDSTAPLLRESLKDAFDDEPDYEFNFTQGLSRVDLRFGQGGDGSLYAFNKANGWVYLVEGTEFDDLLV
ncbi:MAG: Ig-like domain-containing protein, partial [Pseudomonadota bacterium]